jgi:hypothetical protein
MDHSANQANIEGTGRRVLGRGLRRVPRWEPRPLPNPARYLPERICRENSHQSGRTQAAVLVLGKPLPPGAAMARRAALVGSMSGAPVALAGGRGTCPDGNPPVDGARWESRTSVASMVALSSDVRARDESKVRLDRETQDLWIHKLRSMRNRGCRFRAFGPRARAGARTVSDL